MSDPFRPYAVPRLPDEPENEPWSEAGYDEGRYDPRCDGVGYDEPGDVGWGGRGRGADELGMLTEVIFVEGQLVDTRRRPVQGSGYEYVARELVSARRPPPTVTYVQTPAPPHHEPMLRWLDRVVGGRDALLALDDTPLPPSDLDPVPFRSVDLPRLVDIDGHIGRALDRLVAGSLAIELQTATRRLMVGLLTADHRYLERSDRDDLIAGGLLMAVVRASHLVGADRPLLGRTVTEALGLTSPPTARTSSIVTVVGGKAWWYDERPHRAPDVPVLGDPGLLVSSFRRELITARDLALAERDAQVDRSGGEGELPVPEPF
ncbi:MAG: hypothetical protein ABI131_07460 [Nostocoides sp.]